MAKMTPLNKTARALAFYVWGYDPPNEQAVAAAMKHIEKVVRAAEAAGISIVFEDRGAAEDERHKEYEAEKLAEHRSNG